MAAWFADQMDVHGLPYMSPELLGTQGWSPSSSVYSSDSDADNDDDDDIADRKHQRSSGPRPRSVQFPLPPQRLKPTLPLGIVKPRAVSAIIQPHVLGMDDMPLDGLDDTCKDAGKEANCGLDAFGIISAKERPGLIEMPKHARRFFSAPGPLPYEEEEGDEEEPDEYPFPIMPSPPSSSQYQREIAMEDEKAKLRRLQESLSLLSFDPNTRQLRSKALLSPEHRAPSLAEQMAYACGLGSQLAWSSPSKDACTSADHYLPLMLEDVSTAAQDERKMASRHVRQGVAASGYAPLPQSVSQQMLLAGETAEVGSSWSHKGYGDEAASDEEEDGPYLRAHTPSRSFSVRSMATSAAMSVTSSPILHGALSARDFAWRHASESDGDSTDAQSHVGICHESAASQSREVEIERLFAEGLALQCDEGPRSRSSSTSASTESVPTPGQSPNSLHEFSYIVEHDHMDHYAIALSPQEEKEDVFGKDGFNGNTFSPVLRTPELGGMADMPIDCAPSPTLTHDSIEPHPSFLPELSCLPQSSSTLSILERPRPICRSATTSFFGGENVKLAHQLAASQSSLDTRRLSAPRQPSTPSTKVTMPVIPIRKSSAGATLHKTSVQSFFEENDQHLSNPTRKANGSISFLSLPSPPAANTTMRGMTRSQSEMPPQSILRNSMSKSSSTGRMSPRALAQVREACRAKADYDRNVALERLEAEEDVIIAAAAAVRQSVAVSTDQSKKKQTSAKGRPSLLTRSNASEPANLYKVKSRSVTSLVSGRKRGSSQTGSDRSQQSSRPVSRATVAVPDTARVTLPTLYVARSDSQRKRGITGVPETEPDALALANQGKPTVGPTRQSEVTALLQKPDLEIEGGMLNMPHGVILIVEERHVEESQLVY